MVIYLLDVIYQKLAKWVFPDECERHSTTIYHHHLPPLVPNTNYHSHLPREQPTLSVHPHQENGRKLNRLLNRLKQT